MTSEIKCKAQFEGSGYYDLCKSAELQIGGKTVYSLELKDNAPETVRGAAAKVKSFLEENKDFSLICFQEEGNIEKSLSETRCLVINENTICITKVEEYRKISLFACQMLFNVSTLDSNDDSELLKRMVHHAEEIDIFKKQIEAQSNTIRDLQDDISKSERERESFLQFNAQLQDENTRLKDEKTSPKEKTQGYVPDAAPQSSSSESKNEKKKSSRLGNRLLNIKLAKHLKTPLERGATFLEETRFSLYSLGSDMGKLMQPYKAGDKTKMERVCSLLVRAAYLGVKVNSYYFLVFPRIDKT